VTPRTLDHVALWVTERDAIADACIRELGMHVIDRQDNFSLMGVDARRGKLTLFDAEGPREPGALKHVAFRGSGGERDLELPDGLVIRVIDGDDGDLDHVALWSADPDATAEQYTRFGFEPSGPRRVEVAGAYVEFHEGDPGDPERPLLNHLAVLVESAEEHRREAEDAGIEVADFVDAANTIAVFVWGPERVKIEYVEHKPTFALR
jgi:catechol 2,3-dioxygenase-like lactoylglutathione lyase family enzyme